MSFWKKRRMLLLSLPGAPLMRIPSAKLTVCSAWVVQRASSFADEGSVLWRVGIRLPPNGRSLGPSMYHTF